MHWAPCAAQHSALHVTVRCTLLRYAGVLGVLTPAHFRPPVVVRSALRVTVRCTLLSHVACCVVLCGVVLACAAPSRALLHNQRRPAGRGTKRELLVRGTERPH
jgi:hypothetical protein